MNGLDEVQGPRVSVAILSYNRPEFLREALQSVMVQSLQPLEIVIFDNGSKQDVHEKVSDLLGGIVEWRGWEPHSSVENFRRAFAFGRGDYVYVMHDDDRLLPNFLAEMCGHLDAHKELAGVGCNGYRMDVNGQRLKARVLLQRLGDVTFQDQAEMAAHYANSFIPFPSVVYRKGPLTRLTIKEEFGKVWDGIFLCDLAAQGPVAFLDRPLMEYRIHPQQDSVVLPEPQYRLKEDYVIAATAASPLGRRVVTTISKQRAKRVVNRLWRQLLSARGPIKFTSSLSNEARTASHFWLLFYLLNPVYLSSVFLRRFGLH